MADTFYSDVSEFQVPVNDSYPYPILSIRSNDGTYRDGNFAANYAWMRRALDSGKLTAGIVYAYWRTNWGATVSTMRSMIEANGGLHPKVILMIDLERGGNPAGDETAAVDATIDTMAAYTGSMKRVIVYANSGDFHETWANYSTRLPQIGGLIAAGYGSNPNLPYQIAHQYTDGTYGAGQGLPMGAAPFGNCDMNVADGMSASDFAAHCGIDSEDELDMDAATLKGIIFDCLETYCGPGISDGKDNRQQLTGSRDLVFKKDANGNEVVDLVASYPGLDILGHRTVVDALGAACATLNAIAEKIGVDVQITGAFDPKPAGDGVYVAPKA